MTIVWIAVAVFLMNLPFGYWRLGVRKFSLQWFLAVHIPVPPIIGMRLYFDIGFAPYTYVVLVAAFFLGQKVGGMIRQRRMDTGDSK